MLLKIVGISLIILSCLSFLPALVDPVAIIFPLVIMVTAGTTALSGNIKYALIILITTTLFMSYLILSLSGWLPQSNNNEPLPEGIPKVDELPPIPLPDLKKITQEISKETGVLYEERYNTLTHTEIEKNKPSSTKSQTFMLITLVGIPYFITLLFILMGYSLRKKDCHTKSD